MADKKVDIDINVSSNTKGAKEAAKEIKKVGDAAGEASANLNPMVDGQRQWAQTQKESRAAAEEASTAIEKTAESVEALNEQAGKGDVQDLTEDLNSLSEAANKNDFSKNLEDSLAKSNTKIGRSTRTFQRVKDSLNGLTQSSGKLTSALAKLGKGFGITAIVGGFFKGLQFVESGIRSLNAPIAKLNDDLRITGNGFGNVVAPLAAATGGLSSFISTLNQWTNPFTKWTEFRTAVAEQAESIRKLGDAQNDFIDRMDVKSRRQLAASTAALKETEAQLKLKAALDGITESRRLAEEQADAGEKTLRDRIGFLNEAAQAQRNLVKAQLDARIAGVEAQELNPEIEAEKIAKLKAQVDGLFKGIGDTLADSIENALQAQLGNLKDLQAEITADIYEFEGRSRRITPPNEINQLRVAEAEAAKNRSQIFASEREKARLEDIESIKNLLPQLKSQVGLDELDPKAATNLSNQIKSLEASLATLEAGGFVDGLFENDKIKEANKELAEATKALATALDTRAAALGELGVENFDEYNKKLGELTGQLEKTKADIGDKESELLKRRRNKASSDEINAEQKAADETNKNTALKKAAAAKMVEAQEQYAAAIETQLGIIEKASPRLGAAGVAAIPEVKFKTGEISKQQEAANKIVADRLAEGIRVISEVITDGLVSPDEVGKLKAAISEVKATIDSGDAEAVAAVEALLAIVGKTLGSFQSINERIDKLDSGKDIPSGSGKIQPLLPNQVIPEELPKGLTPQAATPKGDLDAGLVELAQESVRESSQNLINQITEIVSGGIESTDVEPLTNLFTELSASTAGANQAQSGAIRDLIGVVNNNKRTSENLKKEIRRINKVLAVS